MSARKPTLRLQQGLRLVGERSAHSAMLRYRPPRRPPSRPADEAEALVTAAVAITGGDARAAPHGVPCGPLGDPPAGPCAARADPRGAASCQPAPAGSLP